jgi:hypothetical protein
MADSNMRRYLASKRLDFRRGEERFLIKKEIKHSGNMTRKWKIMTNDSSPGY